MNKLFILLIFIFFYFFLTKQSVKEHMVNDEMVDDEIPKEKKNGGNLVLNVNRDYSLSCKCEKIPPNLHNDEKWGKTCKRYDQTGQGDCDELGKYEYITTEQVDCDNGFGRSKCKEKIIESFNTSNKSIAPYNRPTYLNSGRGFRRRN